MWGLHCIMQDLPLLCTDSLVVALRFQSLWALQLLCSMWDLSSPIRDWSRVPSTARWFLNHWPAREVPMKSHWPAREVSVYNLEVQANQNIKNCPLNYRWAKIKIISNFSSDIAQARREWSNIFKVLEGKKKKKKQLEFCNLWNYFLKMKKKQRLSLTEIWIYIKNKRPLEKMGRRQW